MQLYATIEQEIEKEATIDEVLSFIEKTPHIMHCGFTMQINGNEIGFAYQNTVDNGYRFLVTSPIAHCGEESVQTELEKWKKLLPFDAEVCLPEPYETTDSMYGGDVWANENKIVHVYTTIDCERGYNEAFSFVKEADICPIVVIRKEI